MTPRNYDFDYDNIKKDNYIVLILVSPHIKEFINGVAIGPAQGNTGENIEKYLKETIENSPIF